MTAINESLTAKGYTPAASVPQVFGRARTIDGIVIHHWGALGQTHDGVVNFFVNGPGETSAHFVASAGRIHCLVSPLDAAWHSGNAVGNATTIGIECRPEATDEDYATVAELVAYLRSEYGDLPLTPHRQWQSTACPGVWDLNRINQLAGAAAISPQSSTPQELTVSEAAEIIRQIGIAHAKENNIAKAVNDIAEKNQLFHSQSHAKLNAIKEVADQIAKGQGVAIDWGKVEASAKAGAAEALAEGIVTVDVSVNGKDAA